MLGWLACLESVGFVDVIVVGLVVGRIDTLVTLLTVIMLGSLSFVVDRAFIFGLRVFGRGRMVWLLSFDGFCWRSLFVLAWLGW